MGIWDHIAFDMFFTFCNFRQLLLKRKMTMLGTIRKTIPELPEEMQNKEVHSSLFCFTEDTTVISYILKKNKSIIPLSTLHRGQEELATDLMKNH
ncbi:hypothetical protein TNCT_456811 [Trichonephila clavata]|uniref:PiggyBac transposable element-derived protein domain-containing protein n=1 Tax=Trichonephila clavata TaxID=2740835 RepID=A0A8X6ISX8_TRICU|nr:hypothetical protein TNCT_456811 [Trichonephila clavata]